MKNIVFILFIISFLTACKKEKIFSFEEDPGSSSVRFEIIQFPCEEVSLEGELYDNFIENGTFIFDYILYEFPRVYIGNSSDSIDVFNYIQDIIKGTEYENKNLDNNFIRNIRKDAINGDPEAWLILHKIAIDSGYEAVSRIGIKVLAYDPHHGLVCIEDINGERSVGGILSGKQDNVFIFLLVEYYLQSISCGNWSLMNLKYDHNAREFCKKKFDEQVKEIFPDYFKERPRIKDYEALKKSGRI